MDRDSYKVHEIRALKGQPDAARALKMLQDACRQVQPIMRKRQWSVPLVTEFSPRNPNLLGLNVGGGGGSTKEIRVRLRPAGSSGDFYPYDHVLGTMLHELTHNVHGPHNAAFYKLLEEITAECEDLMARGVAGTGVGFDGASAGRLGAHSWIPTHNPPAHKLRDAALKAAEERAKRQRIMQPGPQRLGGDAATMRSLPPALAAAQAAERRAADNRWCPGELLASCGAAGEERAVHDVENAAGTGDTGAGSSGRAGAPRQQAQPAQAQPAQAQPAQVQGTQRAGAHAGASTAGHAAGSNGSSRVGRVSANGGGGGDESAAAAAGRALGDLHVQQQGQQRHQQQPWPKQRQQQQQQMQEAGAATRQAVAVVDLTLGDDEEPEVAGQGPPAAPSELGTGRSRVGGVQQRVRLPRRWACPCCTLLNPAQAVQCGACEAPPAAAVAGVSQQRAEAGAAGAGGVSGTGSAAGLAQRPWVCGTCTLENAEADPHCAACGTWRFSRGPPVGVLLPGAAWS